MKFYSIPKDVCRGASFTISKSTSLFFGVLSFANTSTPKSGATIMVSENYVNSHSSPFICFLSYLYIDLGFISLQKICWIFCETCISHYWWGKFFKLRSSDYWKIHLQVKKSDYVPHADLSRGRGKLLILPGNPFLKNLSPSRKKGKKRGGEKRKRNNLTKFTGKQHSFCSRTLTEKKHHQIKLQRSRKVWIWTFGWLAHQINSL